MQFLTPPLAGMLLALAAVLMIAWVASRIKGPTLWTTHAAATAALGHIAEWSKWMAGIQTAAIAGLGVVVFDGDFTSIDLPPSMHGVAVAAFVFLATALLCTSWALAAIPSLTLRMPLAQHYDIYDMTLFGWLERWLPKLGCLGVILTIKHWYWCIGLALLGVLLLNLPLKESRPEPQSTVQVCFALQKPGPDPGGDVMTVLACTPSASSPR